MSDRWTDRISEYIDGGLGAADRRALEMHFAECAACNAALEDLRLIQAGARSLPVRDPESDLWPGIEARIRSAGLEVPSSARPPIGGWFARRLSFSLPQLAAACVALAVLSGGAVWFAVSHDPSRGPVGVAGQTPVEGGGPALAASDHAAVQEIEQLRTVLQSNRADLDPATVRSLEESLLIIDLAIRQAQRALEADPKNPYVREHLDDTMRRKVEFLRRATMLASAPR